MCHVSQGLVGYHVAVLIGVDRRSRMRMLSSRMFRVAITCILAYMRVIPSCCYRLLRSCISCSNVVINVRLLPIQLFDEVRA